MYLLQELIGKHQKLTIGVLGSGPTLNNFKDDINELCDIVIACNGSVNVLDPKKHYIDYFMYYDGASFSRDWFKKSNDFFQSPKQNSKIPFLFKKNRTIRLESEVEEYKYDEDIKRYYYDAIEIPSNIDFKIKFGGKLVYNFCTVSGIAMQVAYHMGASRINLFGCSFDNDSGQNYAYIPQRLDIGQTSNYQRKAMDKIITKIRAKRIEVVSYGRTRLSVPQILS